jgi:hypothetical protein
MTIEVGGSPPARTGRIPADTFAARLRLARMFAGDVSIREAAPRCGLNYGSWTGWERGALPRDLLAVVEAVSEGLDIDRDWLLFGGPLAEAEENRDRWRPHLGKSDIDRYHGVPVRSIGRSSGTRPRDTRPSNRSGDTLLVAA